MLYKIKIIVFVIAGFFSWNDLIGQQAFKMIAGNCPEEKMEVHLSQGSAFPGELLWFKVYCTSSLFPKEELSSLAFIELINSDNASLLRKKILLKQGEGYGEFQIPNNLPTGVYYILAYTNWLKNFGEESFFRKDLIIVNPYQPFNKAQYGTDTVRTLKEDVLSEFGANKLKITPDKKIYPTRQQVNLMIEPNNLAGMAISDYSVSVYRKEPPMIFSNLHSNENGTIHYPEKITYLPDYKGIRLTGKLLDPSESSIPGSTVTEALPGPGTDIKQSITDSKGDFNFLLKPGEGEQEIVFTLPGKGSSMRLEESFWNGFRNAPDKQALSLNKEAITYLERKYMHFQFQDRFKRQNSIKRPSIKVQRDSSLFYSKPYQLIELKDYYTLDSLREYFYELVPSVRFNQRRGELDISVRDSVSMTYYEDKPGVFIDGVLYDNYSEIAAIPVREIDRIAILPKTYYYKDFTFGGIIDIHTVKSDFHSVKPMPSMTRIIYPTADASEWKFTSPDYSLSGSGNRVPDFRYLLYWEPNVRAENSGGAKVQFFTGDVKGTFIVKVVGISETGEIVQAEQEILIDD